MLCSRTSFGTEGTEEGNFRMPGTVSADRDGRQILVTDPGNDRVQIFSADGSLRQALEVDGQTCGGAALDMAGERLLVAIPANDRIQVFNMA